MKNIQISNTIDHEWTASEGFVHAVGISRKGLQILGIWPGSITKSRNRLLRCYFLIPVFTMVYFINIPQTIVLKSIWGDLNEILDVLTTTNIAEFIAIVKMLGIWFNAEVLSVLVASMVDDWRNAENKADLEILWKNAKISKWISIIIMALAAGTVITYLAMNIYVINIEPVQYMLAMYNDSKRMRRLYLKSRFLHDVQTSPYYEIVWIFQCCATFLGALSFSSIDAFFAALVLHVCSQLHILRLQLNACIRNCQNTHSQFFSQVLSRIILRHEHLSRFAMSIETAFSFTLFVQILISGTVLCFQGYQIVVLATSGESMAFFEIIFMINFSGCIMFSLFLYCYVANVLQAESLEIGNAAYESDWYTLLPSEAKCLTFIIIRSKHPFQITAGNFVAFSLELYCKILKTCGGYLSMLLAVKDRLAS